MVMQPREYGTDHESIPCWRIQWQGWDAPMPCGGAEAGVKGGQAVVGVERIGFGGDVDGGSGGGKYRGGGRVRTGWIWRWIELVVG